MISSKSIAVLPFENRSSDPENEYFCDGLTEEIIFALTKVEGLKVTARTSSFVFKNTKTDVREIGKQLNVSLILEGSIRKSRQQIRISAQLIRTSDGFYIWSETFDRKLAEIFSLQDEISLLIAHKIRENYGHLEIEDQLVEVNTKNVQAYQHFLKGRHFYNSWDMQGFFDAARAYEKSISEDPTFDLPYFGAALSYSFLGSWGAMNRDKAFTLVNQYFATGSNLKFESNYRYYSIAKHLFWGLWDFHGAYKSLTKAYELLPQDASNNEFMSEMNALAGNFIVAKKHINTSLEANPLSPTHYYSKAQILFLQNEITEAINVLDKGISVNSDFAISKELRVSCGILLRNESKFREVISDFDDDYKLLFTSIFNRVNKNEPFDYSIVDRVYASNAKPLLAWDLYALVSLKEFQEALRLLQDKVAQKMGHILYLKFDPWLKPLHGSAEFREIVRNLMPENSLITSSKQKSKSAQLNEEEIGFYRDKLEVLMEEELVYLEPNLGLKDMANKIKLHPNKLSWLLNEVINKNFYDFVNGYRLKDFQVKAVDPKNGHLSLLGIALESGFNSKSVFNDYFKRTVGLTPRAWIRQQRS